MDNPEKNNSVSSAGPNRLAYRGYIGEIEFDVDAGIFHGEVINTRDVITFQGDSATELQQAFVDSIEDYLEFCRARGEDPERPFSGKFIVRVEPELHRQIFYRAREQDTSLNQWVRETLEKAVYERKLDHDPTGDLNRQVRQE